MPLPPPPTRSFDTPTPDQVTTLVCGSTTALTTSRGEIHPDALLGVFHLDERIVSSLTMLVDGDAPPLLRAERNGPDHERISYLGAVDQHRNANALIVRRRRLDHARLEEQIEFRSFRGDRTVAIEVQIQSDLASILRLRSAKPCPDLLQWSVDVDGCGADARRPDGSVAARVEATDAVLRATENGLSLTWKAAVSAGGVWAAGWSVHVPGDAASVRTRPTMGRLSVNASDHRWAPAIASTTADLDALLTNEPDTERWFFAAGAPWYLALFGRDSLLTAYESLPLGTDAALAVLDSLAAHQGTELDERRIEAPGKILHELRIGVPQVFGMTAGEPYYGTVDASSLFVTVLREAHRWGAPVERIEALLPAARSAMQWCLDVARRSGPDDNVAPNSPFLWYRSDANGLGNQSWKDSGDCMVHADGSLAVGPFAVSEVQAYHYDALHALAGLESAFGDPAAVANLLSIAAAVRAAFVEQYLDEDGLIALALDGKSAPLRVASSDMGQCLWSDLLPPAHATRVATRVMQPDLLTPWGLRTLGDTTRAYNPLGYHLGTVWAHDTAFAAAGLARHGEREHVCTLTDGLLDAAEHFDWRLPELYGGLDVSADGGPLPYPAACAPQAWSAGAPLLLLRAMLGLEPDVPAGTLRIRSAFAEGERFIVDGVRLGDESIRIEVDGPRLVSVSGTVLRILD